MELESEVRLSGQDSVLLPEMGVSGGQKEGRGIDQESEDGKFKPLP